jgi:hypothetical protein
LPLICDAGRGIVAIPRRSIRLPLPAEGSAPIAAGAEDGIGMRTLQVRRRLTRGIRWTGA